MNFYPMSFKKCDIHIMNKKLTNFYKHFNTVKNNLNNNLYKFIE